MTDTQRTFTQSELDDRIAAAFQQGAKLANSAMEIHLAKGPHVEDDGQVCGCAACKHLVQEKDRIAAAVGEALREAYKHFEAIAHNLERMNYQAALNTARGGMDLLPDPSALDRRKP
jgi:hypothetical protein